MSDEIKKCSCCGAKIVEYTHRINVGLCNALLKLYRSGGVSSVATLGLTTSEYCNFQKLKYWGFVKKVQNTEEKGGTWKITDRGRDFVEGGKVYERVTTFRGEVVKRFGADISMRSVIG